MSSRLWNFSRRASFCWPLIGVLVLAVSTASIFTVYRLFLFDGRSALAQVVPKALGTLQMIDGATPLGCGVATFRTDVTIDERVLEEAKVSRGAVARRAPQYLHFMPWRNLPAPDTLVSSDPALNDALGLIGEGLACSKDATFNDELGRRLYHSPGYWTIDEPGRRTFVAVLSNNTILVIRH